MSLSLMSRSLCRSVSIVGPIRLQSSIAVLDGNRKILTRMVNKNLTLKYSVPASQVVSPEPKEDESGKRPLVIFLSWLMAKEKFLDKYRQIYYKHGFDVLTVKTSPWELLVPKSGTQQIANGLMDFMKEKVSTYPNVVVHGFSVGAYQFSEFLLLLEKGLKQKDGSVEEVKGSIKGVIFDSAVDVQDAPHGVAISIVGENMMATAVEKVIRGYMYLTYPISSKYYYEASRAFKYTVLRCPALLLVSNYDQLGHPRSNIIVRKQWEDLGVDVSWKCWEKSRHVAHFQKYPTEYVGLVDKFLNKINLSDTKH